MLKSLSIKNIAVIENVNIDFSCGFSILTGETGAGKSIIIDAINLLKGERAPKNIVRSGESEARVVGVFDIDEDICSELDDVLGYVPEGEVMISRTINAEGKSTCRIDSSPVTLAILKSLGEKLIDIHGQHDNTNLISKKTHIGFLDSYGGEEIAKIKDEYFALHKEYTEAKKEIDAIDTDERETQRRAELLLYQIEEIEGASLTVGEDEQLEERRNVLKNSYKIASSATKAYSALYGGDDGLRESAYDMLYTAIKAIEPIANLDKSLCEAYEALNEAGDIISVNSRFLKDYSARIETATEEIDKLEERLEEIDTLKRKYGSDIQSVLDKKDAMQAELDGITHSAERLEELNKRLSKLEKEREFVGEKLTQTRKEYAKKLSKSIALSLTELCMPSVRFETDFKKVPCRANGSDDVEFVISTNAGEGLKPLAEIASGGELSRIMLAIKGVLADCDREKLLIFDEVDTGVSGAAAQSIGEKLWRTSRCSQVICITHLPQIAAMADNHYRIEKHTDGEKTKTTVSLIDNDERIKEISRTLGGAEITQAAEENARELVRLADEFKKRG